MHPDIFSRVDAPPTCKFSWDHVDPNQKQWFCAHCQHHVHNLSAMTRREVEKFMRAPCAGRRCVSFLQDDRGRTVFRKAPWFGSIGASLTWLASAIFVFLASGCATAPKEKPAEKIATISESKPQSDQANLQKSEKPRVRRWTGF